MYIQRDYPMFSWSNSRHKTFLDCSRKYYHQYYEYHNGWSFDAPEENKSAYRLKNIKSIPLLLGDGIHRIIDRQLKNFLEGRRLFTEEEMMAIVTKVLNDAYQDSTKNRPSWFKWPKKYQMLYEIYYGDGLSPDTIAATKKKLEVCVKNFFASKTYQDILNNLEMQVLQSEDFHSFDVNGVDVFVVLDFVYQDFGQGKWIVVDWKTGKESEDDRQQLAFYALFLSREHGIPVEDIIIRNEYLLSGESREYKLTQFDIEAAQQVMHDSIFHMLGKLDDPVLNKPFGKEYFELNQSRRCNSCNFKEKCQASGELAAESEDSFFSN